MPDENSQLRKKRTDQVHEHLMNEMRDLLKQPNGPPLWTNVKQVIGDEMKRLIDEGIIVFPQPNISFEVPDEANYDPDSGILNVTVRYRIS